MGRERSKIIHFQAAQSCNLELVCNETGRNNVIYTETNWPEKCKSIIHRPGNGVMFR